MEKLLNITLTAIRFIKYDKAKSIGVLVGIVISTFLIGQQIGIATFLTGLMSSIVDNADADIWIIDNQAKDINQIGLIDVKNVRQAQSIRGVASASALLVAGAKATFQNGSNVAVSLIGSEIPGFQGGPGIGRISAGALQDLMKNYGVSVDFYDRSNFGGSADLGTSFEIGGKRAEVVVQTKGSRGFGGILMYTTIERARSFANVDANLVSAVLVKIRPGVNPDSVVQSINQTLTGVRAWRKEDIRSSTVRTILTKSGIGASTGSLIVFAIVAGFFIIGLTMFSSALDRVKDYGTLKAIGANNSYITWVILGQALSFAVAGFIVAFALLMGFRKGVEASGLLFDFHPLIIAGLFGVTLSISLFGAVFAIRRINGIEPASVFRG